MQSSSQPAFTYRNSNNLRSFDVSKDFLFVVTDTQIQQYTRNTNAALSCELNFTPIFGCFQDDRYLLASKNELFYLKGGVLRKLTDIEPLSKVFTYKGILVMIESRRIRLYKKGRWIEGSIGNEENGLCSGHFIQERGNNKLVYRSNDEDSRNGTADHNKKNDNRIFLGFEDGTVGYVDNLESIENDGFTVKFSKLECFKDPVLSLYANDEWLMVHTLSYIFRLKIVNTPEDCSRIDTSEDCRVNRTVDCRVNRTASKPSQSKNATSPQHTQSIQNTNTKLFTKIRASKMIVIWNNLVLIQEKRLVFLDWDLKVKKAIQAYFDIVDCKISTNKAGECLVVGLKNGLVIEYTALNE